MFFKMERALAVGGDNTRGISLQHHRKSLNMFISYTRICARNILISLDVARLESIRKDRLFALPA